MKLFSLILGMSCAFGVQALAQLSIDFTLNFNSTSGNPVSGMMNLTGHSLSYHFSEDTDLDLAHPDLMEIHGPAVAGSPLIFALGTCSFGLATQAGMLAPCNWEGSLTLSDSQVGEILAGDWYAELERRDHPRARILPADHDNDGVPDYLDKCPHTETGNPVNRDGCGIDDLCPCQGPWKSHGQYLEQFLVVSRGFVNQGIITESEQRTLLRHAASSDCGKAE